MLNEPSINFLCGTNCYIFCNSSQQQQEEQQQEQEQLLKLDRDARGKNKSNTISTILW